MPRCVAYRRGMLEGVAREVVDGLRARGVDAHLTEAGVYTFGIKVMLGR